MIRTKNKSSKRNLLKEMEESGSSDHGKSLEYHEMFTMSAEEVAKIEGLVSTRADAGNSLGVASVRLLWMEMYPELSPLEVSLQVGELFKHFKLKASKDSVLKSQIVSYLDGLSAVKEESKVRHHTLAEYRSFVWEIIDAGVKRSRTTKVLSVVYTSVVQLAVVVSVVNLMVESLPSSHDSEGNVRHDPVRGSLDLAAACVFSCDILLYLFSFPTGPQGYLKKVWFWVDLLTVVPFFLAATGALSGQSAGARTLIVLKILRMAVRLAQALRVVKLGKRSNGMSIVVASLASAREPIMWLMVIIGMTITFCGTILWNAERQDAHFDTGLRKWVRNEDAPYPDAGRVIFFQSIPDTFWFEWVSLTTVGYGDVYPVTPWGKFAGSLTNVASLLVLGYPTTVLMSSFIQEYTRHQFKMQARKTKEKLIEQLRSEKDDYIDESLIGEGSRRMRLRAAPMVHFPRYSTGSYSYVNWEETPPDRQVLHPRPEFLAKRSVLLNRLASAGKAAEKLAGQLRIASRSVPVLKDPPRCKESKRRQPPEPPDPPPCLVLQPATPRRSTGHSSLPTLIDSPTALPLSPLSIDSGLLPPELLPPP